VAVPLTADEKRTVDAEGEDQVFQRTGMTVVDQIFEKTHITLIHFLLEFTERDPGSVDDRRFTAQMIDQSDPSLTVKDGDMIFRRDIDMLLSHDKNSFC
jgi:hypothetical protein